MKRAWFRVSLVRLAAAAWLAWLVTLVITAWLSFSGVLHPSFLYMAIPLAVQLLCTVALLLGGIWRVFRGPRRGRAVVLTLLGLLPALWMAAYAEYGIGYASKRSHRPNFLVEAGEALGSLLAEPYVRIYYPYRHEGQRFVMWSDLPEADDAVIAAMDAHIRAMEESLGGRSEYKVYWVRGPVLGIYGRYGCGWALGSPTAWSADGTDGLHSTDRHEVAHFALHQLLPPSQEAPSLLHEGWAQLHTGMQARHDWRTCWRAWRQGRLVSLRELVSPSLYYHATEPMYTQGHVLVEYLIERFGHAKFVEFCRTCREATFDEDLRRVFGLGLDELDQAYQQDLAQYDSPAQRFLLSLKLADEVDPQRWRRFVDDYCAGVTRLCAPFHQSSVKMLLTFEHFGNHEEHSSRRDHVEMYRDGPREANISDHEIGRLRIDLRMSTPEVRLYAYKDRSGVWQTVYRQDHPEPPPPDRETVCAMSDSDTLYLYLALDPLRLEYEAEAITITAIGASPTDDELVRISFTTADGEDEQGSGIPGWWDLDPRRDYGLVESRYGNIDGQPPRPTLSKHITVEYQTIDGHNVPKTARLERLIPHNVVRSSNTYEVESCEFAAPPPEVFKPSTYGQFSPPLLPQWPPQPRIVRWNESSPNVGVLAWIAGGCSLLALLLGAVLMLKSRGRRRPE